MEVKFYTGYSREQIEKQLVENHDISFFDFGIIPDPTAPSDITTLVVETDRKLFAFSHVRSLGPTGSGSSKSGFFGTRTSVITGGRK